MDEVQMISIPGDFVPTVRPESEWKAYPEDSISYYIITELQGLDFGTLKSILGLDESELASKLAALADMGVIEPPPGYKVRDFAVRESLLPPLDSGDEILLNAEVDISPERREEIIRLHKVINSISSMDLFSLKTGYTTSEVTTAYKNLTKRFHPDRYYGKELGPYKTLLEEIFDVINKSYSDLLSGASSSPTPEQIAYQPTIQATAAQLMTPQSGRKSVREEIKSKISADSSTMAIASVSSRAVGSSKKIDKDTDSSETGESESPDHGLVRSNVRRRGLSLRDILSKAVAKNKEKADFHFYEGKKALNEGNYAAAASHFKVAMTFDQSNMEIRSAYEVAANKAGELSAQYYAQKAKLEWDLGHRDEAANFQMVAVELNRKEEYLLVAAEMLVELRRFAQAKELAEEAALQNPSGRGQLMLAKVYIAAEKYHRAVSTLEEYLRYHPDDSEAKLLLSVAKGNI